VIVEEWPDNTVIVSESFDSATAAKLSSAIRTAPAERHASNLPQDELSLRLYDLPAFREWQGQMRNELIRTISEQSRRDSN
jgi:hypothetical protein